MRKLVNNTNKLVEPGDILLTYHYDLKNPKKRMYRSPELVADSYVKAFFVQLFSAFTYASPTVTFDSAIAAVDITNTSYYITYYPYYVTAAAAGNSNYGLVVGSGDTAVTINDYKLDTKIDTGTSAGQLQYGSHTAAPVATDATTSYFTIARTFTNGSGGTVTIKEIGLYGYITVAGPNRYFLLVRDVLASSQDVLDGGQITFTYTIKATI